MLGGKRNDRCETAGNESISRRGRINAFISENRDWREGVGTTVLSIIDDIPRAALPEDA